MSRVVTVLALSGLAVMGVVATGSAAPPSEPDLSNVATANTKAVGYAPASKLSVELRPDRRRPGLDRAREPDRADRLLRLRERRRQRGRPDEAADGADARASRTRRRRPSRTRTRTSSSSTACTAPTRTTTTARTSCTRATRTRPRVDGAKQGYITRINLDADAAHRVTLLATRTSTARRSRRSTARPGIRGPSELLFTTENAERADLRGDAGLPVDRRRRLGRARPRRLRGHPERLRRQPLDRRGHRRREQGRDDARSSRTASSTATCPRTPGDLAQRQAPGAPGAATRTAIRSRSSRRQPLNAPDQLALHTYGNVFDTRWVTIHDTAADGNAPFNANVAAKAAHATPFKRPGERRSSGPGSHFTRVLLRRDRRHERDQPRERRTRAAGARSSKLDPAQPVADDRHADAVLQGRPGAHRLRQRGVPVDAT